MGVPRLCVPNSEPGTRCASRRVGSRPRGMGPLAYTNLFPNRSYPLCVPRASGAPFLVAFLIVKLRLPLVFLVVAELPHCGRQIGQRRVDACADDPFPYLSAVKAALCGAQSAPPAASAAFFAFFFSDFCSRRAASAAFLRSFFACACIADWRSYSAWNSAVRSSGKLLTA